MSSTCVARTSPLCPPRRVSSLAVRGAGRHCARVTCKQTRRCSPQMLGWGRNDDGGERGRGRWPSFASRIRATPIGRIGEGEVDERGRRTACVEFTCDKCEARTKRNVNPHALAKGLVYVQCGNCEAWHQLVDNLGLVVEYRFSDDDDDDADNDDDDSSSDKSTTTNV